MSLITLNGQLSYDPTLFDDINLPLGLDKETLIDELIEHSGDLGCYYDEPTRFKRNITHWFNVVYYPNMERMLKALNADYNPIHNYLREEDWTDSGWTHNKVEVDSTVEVDSNTQGNVSAYDSSTYSPSTESVVDGTQETDGTTTQQGSNEQKHKGTIVGNIGVTTNQKMVSDEMSLRLKYNIYDVICAEFEKRFLVQLY